MTTDPNRDELGLDPRLKGVGRMPNRFGDMIGPDPDDAFNAFIHDQIRETVERAIRTVNEAEESTYRQLLVARGWTPPDHEGELRADEIREAATENERARAAGKIRRRFNELGGRRAMQVGGSGYLLGCLHGLDHALHMVENRKHPADPT